MEEENKHYILEIDDEELCFNTFDELLWHLRMYNGIKIYEEVETESGETVRQKL